MRGAVGASIMPPMLTQLSNELAGVVSTAAPSIVQVQGRRRPGTGLVYAEDVVLTTMRALGREDGLRVKRHDGQVLDAEFAGWDVATTLALLRVPGLGAPVASVSTAAPRVGQLAVALAQSWSNATTASLGLVAVIGGPLRTSRRHAIDEVIRVSAPMHDGFSGGALLDTDAGVIGVTTAAAIRGLGVVIPAPIAWKAAAHVLEHGRGSRGCLYWSVYTVRSAARSPEDRWGPRCRGADPRRRAGQSGRGGSADRGGYRGGARWTTCPGARGRAGSAGPRPARQSVHSHRAAWRRADRRARDSPRTSITLERLGSLVLGSWCLVLGPSCRPGPRSTEDQGRRTPRTDKRQGTKNKGRGYTETEAALMRVVLVGPPAERRRLRLRLPPGVEVVAEYETADDARASGIAADAVMAAPAIPARAGAPDEPPIAEGLVEHLTPRETQVLTLLAEGLSNRGIAERLGISDRPVKFHVASVMGKLGTRNRVETVRLAVRRGIDVAVGPGAGRQTPGGLQVTGTRRVLLSAGGGAIPTEGSSRCGDANQISGEARCSASTPVMPPRPTRR